jgi:hypothetical protein
MGIFDPLEVITTYSLQEAIEDGVLVEIFKNKWKQLSGGKPIVCSVNLYENVSQAGLMEIWNEFVDWKNNVMPGLPLQERNFQTEVNGMFVWVIDDGVCFTLLYPEDY